MHSRVIIWSLLALTVGAALGYYFGYNFGYDEAVSAFVAVR